MGKTRQYNMEGVLLEIPLCYDERTGREIEIYPDFVKDPVYTPEGCPVLFTGEDACAYAQASDGATCIDCGSCQFYRQKPGALIGVCGHIKKRRNSDSDETNPYKGGTRG